MWAVIVAVVVLGTGSLGVFKTLKEPELLYVHSGSLAECPNRPSCVSSLAAEGSDFHVAPLPAASQAQMRDALTALGGQIKHQNDGYLHALFVTPKMKFHDDLEVLQDGDRWQVRSVSRFGYRDFGVNAKRVDALRAALGQREVDVPR